MTDDTDKKNLSILKKKDRFNTILEGGGIFYPKFLKRTQEQRDDDDDDDGDGGDARSFFLRAFPFFFFFFVVERKARHIDVSRETTKKMRQNCFVLLRFDCDN